MEHLPNIDGISIFGTKFLQISIDKQFVTTLWPILLLFAGLTIRVVLDKYVRHIKLRQVGREYWLFITTYVILALMVSDVIRWSFIKIMMASVLIVFIITAGLFKVSADAISGLWSSVKVVGRSGKIAMMYIAFLAARIAKILSNFVKFIRELYRVYILEPFRGLRRIIHKFLDNIENKARELLEKEQLDDSPPPPPDESIEMQVTDKL